MSAVSIKIEQFEGPLDLLLHLIQVNKYDIFDIPIVSITEQYMEVLEKMQEFDMEVATEFLLMAATLLQIKSRMLLPKNPVINDEDEEQEDPGKLLMEMLIEYRKIKIKAAALAELKVIADSQQARTPMYRTAALTLPQYSIKHLLLALSGMVEEVAKEFAYIEPQAFSVEGKMNDILERLNQAVGGVILSDFFQSGQAGEKIASFLGLLELLRVGKVIIEQKEAFAPIYIFVRKAAENGI